MSTKDDIPIKENYINSPQTKNIKKKRKLKKWVWNLLLVFFIMLTILSIFKILVWNTNNKDTKRVIDEISKETNIIEIEDTEETELISVPDTEENDYWYYIKFPLIDVDISKLKEKNSDTVGWISVNNTNINYPFVQTTDNSYYLDHSYDKTYNEAGWVFLDYRNDNNLDNKNSILYAHSRLDKTMFGSLSKVLKNDWYTNKDNHIIRISTEEENTLWQIFSVYKIEEESYYITTNFQTDTDYKDFLDILEERSIYDFNTDFTSNDQILTLSTCYNENIRTVVHAKLIKRSTKA